MFFESKIPQIYDLSSKEIAAIEKIDSIFFSIANNMGFEKIETATIEEEKRYLTATAIHDSKIFRVVRPKEKSVFALQSDLAMSMSRFVADNMDYANILKFYQLGNIYRDRIENKKGYRRNFKQILLGVWGSENIFYEKELLKIAIQSLNYFNSSAPISNIEISNLDVYDKLSSNLSEKIRFYGIEALEEIQTINEFDKNILKDLYKKNVSLIELKKSKDKITNKILKDELKKMIEIGEYISFDLNLSKALRINFNNLEGTNHYNGRKYRIYLNINNVETLIIDGGRIDNMVKKFSKRPIPGVCLGVGVQILNTAISSESQNIKALFSEDDIAAEELIDTLNSKFKESISKFPIKIKNKSKFFKSNFYKNSNFIIFENGKVSFKGTIPLNIRNEINSIYKRGE